MDGVHAPSEAPHGLSSVFIPDINLFSASCKYGTPPMMINTMIKILMSEKEQGVLNPPKKGKYWPLTNKCVTFKTWYGSCTPTTELWNEQWQIQNFRIRGGGWSSRPWRKGGPTLPPLDLPLMNTHQLERFEMAVRMSILKQVTESDWVMHINYCITSNQRVNPVKVSKSQYSPALQACSRLQESEESGSGKVAWKPHGG